MKWEYTRLHQSSSNQAMDVIGQEGWEFVAFHPITAEMVFKRKCRPDPKDMHRAKRPKLSPKSKKEIGL